MVASGGFNGERVTDVSSESAKDVGVNAASKDHLGVAEPACEACGYSLAGHTLKVGLACPECGIAIPEKVWTPRPWPGLGWLWFLECGSVSVTLVLTLILSLNEGVRDGLVLELGPSWMLAILCFGLFAPLGMAGHLASTRQPRTRRTVAFVKLAVPAIVFNAAAIAGAAALFSLILQG